MELTQQKCQNVRVPALWSQCKTQQFFVEYFVTLTSCSTLDRCLSAFAHLLVLATIACFVLFVEQTILEAGITGVNTIRTTVQLIPFVIGVVSVVVALRDLVMLSLWKVSDCNVQTSRKTTDEDDII